MKKITKKTPFFFSVINLGCTKNLVDTQFLLGRFLGLADNNPNYDIQYIDDPYSKEVNTVFLNTCGFILSGREEMFATIEKLIKHDKKVVLRGCALSYYEKNTQPTGRDLIIKEHLEQWKKEGKLQILSRNSIDQLTPAHFSSQEGGYFQFPTGPRAYTNLPYRFEYLKIAEGCDNHCSFCIIPRLRGKQASLTKQQIIDEAQSMISQSVEEIILIAQDSTRYGTDLYNKPALFDLLAEIDKLPGDFMYRVLYLYPDTVTKDQLLKLSKLKKFIPYFDIPLQHSSSSVLKRMGRFYDEKATEEFLETIKKHFPTKYMRTNIIIGFPGETQEEFDHLVKFLKRHTFDNIALFEYHDEPLAASSKLPDKIPSSVIRERFLILDEIVEQQLQSNEKKRKKEDQFGYIMDIKTQGKTAKLIVRPWLHAPEIDTYDIIDIQQVVSVFDDSGELFVGKKIGYIL